MSEGSCKDCRDKVYQLATGNTYACDECNREWQKTRNGLYRLDKTHGM